MKSVLAAIGGMTVFFWLAAAFHIGEFQYIYAPAGKYKCEQVKP